MRRNSALFFATKSTRISTKPSVNAQMRPTERFPQVPTNHLTVNNRREALRQRLSAAHVGVDGVNLTASGIPGPDDDLTKGPGLVLDFGAAGPAWCWLMWDDRADRWDITTEGESKVYHAATDDDAYTHCLKAACERAKRL
jgi:hypothetical protein